MIRWGLAACGLILVAGPVVAQGVERQGRYRMSPADGGGFVRLDTETGAMALCQRRDGDWSCRDMQDETGKVRQENDRLARENGGTWVYDSHEYAAQELPESWRWRVFVRGLATNIERRYIGRASLVSTVSGGIARCLAADHALRDAVLVIRNVPEDDGRQPLYSTSRKDGRIRVLYHGAITPFRGLHEVVESVRFWRPGRELILRGPSSASYRKHLEGIVARWSLADRVSILPPVSPTELIASASTCDVGIVSLPDTSHQNAYALPNKVFEYMKSGLALMVPELAELAGLVRKERNGFVFRRLEPMAVAEAVNSLDPERVEDCKARSRAAAPSLTWKAEAGGWAARIAELARGSSRDGRNRDQRK